MNENLSPVEFFLRCIGVQTRDLLPVVRYIGASWTQAPGSPFRPIALLQISQ